MKSPDQVPVLVTAFNRPHLLKELFDRLRSTRPKTLFVAFDGPREHVPADAELVLDCIESLNLIDWPCDVHTLVRPTNLGCGAAMAEAVTWFLDEVTEGIILEDDIRPLPGFFSYCAKLLDYHRGNHEIIGISSATVVPADHLDSNSPTRLSRFPSVWGWATWKDRWSDYRLELDNWRSEWPLMSRLMWFNWNPLVWAVWERNLSRTSKGRLDTWDYQWVYLAMRTRRLTVVPRVSLVENVGWGPDATHTVDTPSAPLVYGPHPVSWLSPDPVWDRHADSWTLRHAYGAKVMRFVERMHAVWEA